MLFQAMVVGWLRRDRMLHYLGNMMTISLAGAILLSPALLIPFAGLENAAFVYAGYFLLVAGAGTFPPDKAARNPLDGYG